LIILRDGKSALICLTKFELGSDPGSRVKVESTTVFDLSKMALGDPLYSSATRVKFDLKKKILSRDWTPSEKVILRANPTAGGNTAMKWTGG
jgi:hypothetical protein